MKSYLLKAAAAAVLALSAGAAQAQFPERDLQGIIQWGAGGGTDVVMRAVTPHAEQLLGRSIVLSNRTGGAGAIATRFVATQKADGYTLLMGAENPQIYKVMGLGDIDYSAFAPINILARGVPLIVANNDAPFNTFDEMVAYIQANPGKVRMGSTGPGGVPSVVAAMLESQIELPVTAVPYDGDGPAQTALMSGAVDILPAVLGAAIENVKGGRVKAIALIDKERHALLPDVPAISETNQAFDKFLPWGPFFGIFVHKDAPADAIEALRTAFKTSAEQDGFKKLMDDRGFIQMNITGDEAVDYLQKYQSVTSWLVYDGGIAKASPEEFGIPRP